MAIYGQKHPILGNIHTKEAKKDFTNPDDNELFEHMGGSSVIRFDGAQRIKAAYESRKNLSSRIDYTDPANNELLNIMNGGTGTLSGIDHNSSRHRSNSGAIVQTMGKDFSLPENNELFKTLG